MQATTPVPTAPTAQSEWMHQREAMQLLPLDARTFRRFIREGKIPRPDLSFSPVNQLWRRKRFLDWLNSQTAEQTAPSAAEVSRAS